MSINFIKIFDGLSHESSEKLAKHEDIALTIDEDCKNRIYDNVMIMINNTVNDSQ